MLAIRAGRYTPLAPFFLIFPPSPTHLPDEDKKGGSTTKGPRLCIGLPTKGGWGWSGKKRCTGSVRYSMLCYYREG